MHPIEKQLPLKARAEIEGNGDRLGAIKESINKIKLNSTGGRKKTN